jgi:hypothetical protein
MMVDYALMNQCLYEGKAKEVEQMTKDALAEGRSVQEVLNEGLIAGMSVVGEDFKHNILYVPEVLIAARAMKAGMAVLKPLLSAREAVTRIGVLLMGTVRGDLHDIGKNLVCMMAEGAGFEVYDIGVDQSVEKFMAAAAGASDDHRHERAAHHHHDLHEDGDRRLRRRPAGERSKWPWAARPSARCSPTRSARMDMVRTLPPPSICFCGWRERIKDHGDIQNPLLAGDSLAGEGRGHAGRGQSGAAAAIHGAYRRSRPSLRPRQNGRMCATWRSC